MGTLSTYMHRQTFENLFKNDCLVHLYIHAHVRSKVTRAVFAGISMFTSTHIYEYAANVPGFELAEWVR
jgi:hypothetical protein